MILSLSCLSCLLKGNSLPTSSRTVTKIWASRCWEIFLASNLLGESVAWQDTWRVAGGVAAYVEPHSDKALVELLGESLLVGLRSKQASP
jgi:hypothetical protein